MIKHKKYMIKIFLSVKVNTFTQGKKVSETEEYYWCINPNLLYLLYMCAFGGAFLAVGSIFLLYTQKAVL